MKNKKVLSILIAFVACAITIFFGTTFLTGNLQQRLDGSNSAGIALAAPTLDSPAFPENEAGISAYLRPAEIINIEDTKPAFSSIDDEHENYIIGTVAVAQMAENEYPYVYVASNGWIVSYYPRDYRSDAVITPFGYDFLTTNLAEAIRTVCEKVSAPFQIESIGYYHFGYPEATGIVLALEQGGYDRPDVFYITVPDSFTLCSVAWGYRSSGYQSSYNYAALDGVQFASGITEEHKQFGWFDDTNFAKGMEHRIEVYLFSNSGLVQLGLVIIYRD